MRIGNEGRNDVISMQPCGLRLWQVSAPFAEQRISLIMLSRITSYGIQGVRYQIIE